MQVLEASESRPLDRPMLESFLADRDTPCPGCGYNLRGLTGRSCPECNQGLELSVTLSEGRVGQLMAAVVGLAVGAGAAGIFLLALGVFIMREWSVPRGREAWIVIGIPAAALVSMGVPLILLVRRRGRVWFRGLGPGGRGLVITLAWIAPPAFLTWFLASLLM